jgi:hypothetical protein
LDASNADVTMWRNEMARDDGSWFLIEEYADAAAVTVVQIPTEDCRWDWAVGGATVVRERAWHAAYEGRRWFERRARGTNADSSHSGPGFGNVSRPARRDSIEIFAQRQ